MSAWLLRIPFIYSSRYSVVSLNFHPRMPFPQRSLAYQNSTHPLVIRIQYQHFYNLLPLPLGIKELISVLFACDVLSQGHRDFPCIFQKLNEIHILSPPHYQKRKARALLFIFFPRQMPIKCQVNQIILDKFV